jgi:hypothetical protein
LSDKQTILLLLPFFPLAAMDEFADFVSSPSAVSAINEGEPSVVRCPDNYHIHIVHTLLLYDQ